MIKVKNYSNILSNNQIQDLINLLHKKYRNMDIKVYILKNKWQSLIYYPIFKKLQTEYIFKKLTYGIALYKYNKIFLFPFNYKMKDKKIKALNVIATIYHEIRHKYQEKNFPVKHLRYSLNAKCSLTSSNYNKQWQEKDAIGFSNKILINNYQKISKIIDYDDWKIIK